MTGPRLPHQRHYAEEFEADQRGRIRIATTIVLLSVMASVFIFLAFTWGIREGRQLERAEHLREDAKKSIDGAKPAYGLKQFACTASERHEYIEACKQRLRSNLTPRGL